MFAEIQYGKSGDQGLRTVLGLVCETRNSHDWKRQDNSFMARSSSL